MKFLIKNLSFALAGLMLLASCKKVENKVVFEGGSAPVLTASINNGGVVPLATATKNNTAIVFSWTNPNYMFNTGVSSQNVSYTLQIDKPGANFSSGTVQEKSFSGDLSGAITQVDLNKMLIGLELPFDQESTFEARIMSSLGDGSVPQYSNVLTFKASPFLDVLVPIFDALYIVGGDAMLGGWANGGAYAKQNQEFTRASLTTYEITVQLSGGDNTTDKNQFLFVPNWGDWSHKYACKKTTDQSTTGGSFSYDGNENFPGPTEAGDYKIVVDFLKGTYSVTKQ